MKVYWRKAKFRVVTVSNWLFRGRKEIFHSAG